MLKKLYIILPIVAFSIIFIHAFYGHLIFDFGYEQDVNKYSDYIHLQPEWNSHPRNIIFDVTTVWTNSQSAENNPFYEPEIDVQLKTEYNPNELQYINGKSYVELKHEFSDCKNEWKPIAYRHTVDTVRTWFNYLIGLQLNLDPYVVIYPTISNEKYSNSEQKTKIESGYSHFIPICTNKEITSYDYSVKITDEEFGFDVYFVSSSLERQNYHKKTDFNHYKMDGCFGENLQLFSGTCENVEKNSGLLIIVPDELNHSVTKISVNLHEKI